MASESSAILGGAPPPTRFQPPARPVTDALTHREVLEAAGIDANSPGQVLRRLFCRGTRARNLTMMALAILLCTLAVTTRANDNRRYIVAPSRVFSEDAHLEAQHWTQFRHGAPLILSGINVTATLAHLSLWETDPANPDRVLRRLMFEQHSMMMEPVETSPTVGTAGLLQKLWKCVRDPDVFRASLQQPGTTAATSAAAPPPTKTQADGEDPIFPDSDANTAVSDADANTANVRVAVDPIVIDPAGKEQLHQQQLQGRHITRKLQWNRLMFVLTGVSGATATGAATSPDLACLTMLRASALAFDGTDWSATHGGVPVPTPAHLVSVALPQGRINSAAAAAASASVQSSSMNRFSVLVAPAAAAASNNNNNNNNNNNKKISDDAATTAVGGYAWWAAQRVKHTPPGNGLLLFAPPSTRGMAAFRELDDAVKGRWYHEHHDTNTGSSKSRLFAPPAPTAAAAGSSSNNNNSVSVVNPVLPVYTVSFTTDLGLVGPVTTLHEGVGPSTVPLAIVVRPDGFGVYRCVKTSATKASSSTDGGDAQNTPPPTPPPAAANHEEPKNARSSAAKLIHRRAPTM